MQTIRLERAIVFELLLQVLQDRLAFLLALHVVHAVLGVLMRELEVALLHVVVGQELVRMSEIAGEIVVDDRQIRRSVRVRVNVVRVGRRRFVCFALKVRKWLESEDHLGKL